MPKILVLDDSPIFRDIVTQVIADTLPGYRQLVCGTAQEAIRAYDDNVPWDEGDMAMMDIRMKEGPNGFAVSNYIREKNPLVRRCMLTSYDLDAYREAAHGDGANFLVKDDLLRLTEYLKNAGKRRAGKRIGESGAADAAF